MSLVPRKMHAILSGTLLDDADVQRCSGFQGCRRSTGGAEESIISRHTQKNGDSFAGRPEDGGGRGKKETLRMLGILRKMPAESAGSVFLCAAIGRVRAHLLRSDADRPSQKCNSVTSEMNST